MIAASDRARGEAAIVIPLRTGGAQSVRRKNSFRLTLEIQRGIVGGSGGAFVGLDFAGGQLMQIVAHLHQEPAQPQSRPCEDHEPPVYRRGEALLENPEAVG